MKPLTPVKAVALTALAAGLALPVAHAQPAVLAAHFPAPTLAQMRQTDAVLKHFDAYKSAYKALVPVVPAADTFRWNRIFLQHVALKSILVSMPWRSGVPNPIGVKNVIYLLRDNAVLVDATPAGLAQVQEVVKGLDVAPVGTPVSPSLDPLAARPFLNPLVTLDLKKVSIRQALDTLFTAAKANYTVAAGVPGDSDIVTVHLTNVPLAQALDAVLAASEPPLLYTVQGGGIFVVTPKHVTLFENSFTSVPFKVSPPDGLTGLFKGITKAFTVAPPMSLRPVKPMRLLVPTSPKGIADLSASPPLANWPPANSPNKAP